MGELVLGTGREREPWAEARVGPSSGQSRGSLGSLCAGPGGGGLLGGRGGGPHWELRL